MPTVLIVIMGIFAICGCLAFSVFAWDEAQYRRYKKKHPQSRTLDDLLRASMPYDYMANVNESELVAELYSRGFSGTEVQQRLDEWKRYKANQGGAPSEAARQLGFSAAMAATQPTCPKCDKRPISPPDYLCADCRITPDAP